MSHGSTWFKVHNRSGNHGSERYRRDVTSSSAGGYDSHNNMPPYYVLIYIMKVYN